MTKSILITGGASGIGRATAERFTEEGAEVEAMVEFALEEHGSIDVLVNAAGVPDLKVPIESQSVADWQRVIDVHLRGTYLCAKAVLPGMQERGSGVVVNVSSVTSFGAFPSSAAYGPAKSAVNNLTKVLAVESAADGVRVNAVAPGFVHTPMIDPLFEDGTLDADAIAGRIPLGRMAEPAEVADAISLLTDERAGYITGVVLPVDGGWQAYGYV